MSDDVTDMPEEARPLSADLGWIALFIGVVVFSVAGLIGWVRL